ncbi:uncharacterized protein [Arachis hypogaea]|uniref:uncharacterized protein n=1 Tax=Arachis hypogaea TaxID=3818 RepID=UPI003B218724
MEMRAVEGASEQVREQNAKEEEEQGTFDLENGQMKFEEKVMSDHNNNGNKEFQASKFERLNPTNPLRIVINNATRVASLSPDHLHQSQQPPPSQPSSTPSIPQISNCDTEFKKIYQQDYPVSVPSSHVLEFLSLHYGLYACWVHNRIKFCIKILTLSLKPVFKFHDLNQPTFYMLGAALFWMSLWSLAVIGALNFYLPSLVIIALVLSLAWTSKIMRNVVNISVSRVVALYYLRGMQSSTKFGFLRALTRNLGSACLGSLFVPAIEATKVVARFLNLVEGEDEFLFCCARCCFRVMESIFRYGNGWAYVQIAAYGKGFVAASQDTWSLFKRLEMEPIVDSDITSSICFLSGVSIASICVIAVSPWISQLYQNFTATLSLLTFFIGYLLTRIAMALPQACVSC